jgi:beta-galactosidase/beta-glucuronidase
VADLYVCPDIHTGQVRVEVALTEAPELAADLVLRVRDGRRLVAEEHVPAATAAANACLTLKDFGLWAPAHPKLYGLEVAVVARRGRRVLDRVDLRFGMREIRTDAQRFYLNDQPIYVRCFGDDQFYPHSLAPPPDKAWYLERLRRARAYGFCASKSCVEILPQEYVEAADEAGFLLIQEMPFGLSGLRANREVIDERFRDYYRREAEGLIRDSRNHASVIAFSMCSEMGIGTQESFDFFCRELPLLSRRLAPHALVIDCTGFLETEETPRGRRVTDFYATVMPAWMKEVLDETAVRSDGRHPTLLHEYNWWSCYPDPQDRPRWESTQFHPYWLDTLEEKARENGQEALIATYRRNSLWLQALCRKDGMEYARRNPVVEGYCCGSSRTCTSTARGCWTTSGCPRTSRPASSSSAMATPSWYWPRRATAATRPAAPCTSRWPCRTTGGPWRAAPCRGG